MLLIIATLWRHITVAYTYHLRRVDTIYSHRSAACHRFACANHRWGGREGEMDKRERERKRIRNWAEKAVMDGKDLRGCFVVQRYKIKSWRENFKDTAPTAACICLPEQIPTACARNFSYSNSRFVTSILVTKMWQVRQKFIAGCEVDMYPKT